ncbi:MAG: ABC transporter ATP-binding protein [Phormidesmis priestleyi]|uniref:ABC transporter ATP-binding protein n=1 Tax=Phormidesmis priestleyi TaxID=268141 RepID=A0A2W4XGT0_9CYAN|nr:MAG: ABC transporter ATP-binding protein [Phormidesmis priestleyi]
MERFNFKVFKRFWAIAKAYWFGEDKWKARGLLLLIVVLLLGYTGLSVLLNTQRGELISALSAQSESRFWKTVGIFLGILIVYAPLLAGYTFLRDRLALAWRRWLTDSFIDRYFRDRAFYNINQFSPDIDNPDQRIAEDVRSFTQESLTLGLVAVESVLSIIAFSGVLWGISRELVLFLIIYAVAGTALTIGVFGQPLVKLNFEQLKKEANFRFSLVRVRENAEAIAFYQGERQESEQIKDRFIAAFDNYKKLLSWELALNGLTNFYEFIPFVLPAIVVAPGVFSGEVEVGKVSEAQGAFIRVFFSLNVIVARLQSLTAFGAGIDRLYDFSEAIGDIESPDALEDKQHSEAPQVLAASLEDKKESEGDESATAEGAIHSAETHTPANTEASLPVISLEISSTLALDDLTLQTPNYQRTLIENLSLTLDKAGSLLVMGPSGCGKSSLMRAIAGLWQSGTGTILRPDIQDLLFLPQKPYMVLGNLRQQMLYPYPDTKATDRQLTEVLKQVNLPDLAERYDEGFDTVEEWGDVLSLGEQQRLSFARVLIHQPVYTILDEATSALDRANEEQLYGHLATAKTAYISVGHRESLENYHQSVLRLAEDHTWKISIIDESH